MATMEIRPEEMISLASDIKGKIEEWDANVNQIYQAETELMATCEGEMATAFKTRFEKDRQEFTKLSQVMTEYQQAIITLANKYKEMDTLGKTIAQQQ